VFGDYQLPTDVFNTTVSKNIPINISWDFEKTSITSVIMQNSVWAQGTSTSTLKINGTIVSSCVAVVTDLGFSEDKNVTGLVNNGKNDITAIVTSHYGVPRMGIFSCSVLVNYEGEPPSVTITDVIDLPWWIWLVVGGVVVGGAIVAVKVKKKRRM